MSGYNLAYSEDQLNTLIGRLDNSSSTLTSSTGFSFVEASPIYNAFTDLTTSSLPNTTLHDSDSTGTALGGSLTGSDDTKIATSKLVADGIRLRGVFDVPDARNVYDPDDKYLSFVLNHSLNRVPTKAEWFYECHTALPDYDIDAGDIVVPFMLSPTPQFIMTDTAVTLSFYDNTIIAQNLEMYLHSIRLWNVTTDNEDLLVPTSTNFNLVIYATF